MPWPRAAEIEGSARASIMLARTWRKKIGSVPNTRAVTGSVKCAATSLTFAKVPRSANCVDAMPPAANALVRIAKIKSAKANSRSGTVNSTADPATVTRSPQRFRLSAAYVPSGIEISQASRAAVTVSRSVLRARLQITCETGKP